VTRIAENYSGFGVYMDGQWPISYDWFYPFYDRPYSGWPQAWAEVGTQVWNGQYMIKRGFLRTPTFKAIREPNPLLHLFIGSYCGDAVGVPGWQPDSAFSGVSFQVFYGDWHVAGAEIGPPPFGPIAELKESAWNKGLTPATEPIEGPIDLTEVSRLDIPMINTSNIHWLGDTYLVIRALTEGEPTEIGTLNGVGFGSLFPNGLPCIGMPQTIGFTPLTPGVMSGRAGTRGVGLHA
jgi:hypothetical protein